MKNIAIIAEELSATVTNELTPELTARGHSVDVVDVSSVHIDTFFTNEIIQSLCSYDLVYYRTGLSPDITQSLEKYLVKNNIPSINLNYIIHPFIDNKTYQILAASEESILVPMTLYDRKSSYRALEQHLGSKFIAKANISSQGREVRLIQNSTDLEKIAAVRIEREYFFQEYIPHEAEYRVHIVGNNAKAMYKRVPPPDDFRSNVSVGALMKPVEDEYRQKLEELGLAVAEIFDFRICAIDFMLHKNTKEFYFTEINLKPGWEESDKIATGSDMSALVADYIENYSI